MFSVVPLIVSGAYYGRVISDNLDARDRGVITQLFTVICAFEALEESFSRAYSSTISPIYSVTLLVVGGVALLQGSECIQEYPLVGRVVDWLHDSTGEVSKVILVVSAIMMVVFGNWIIGSTTLSVMSLDWAVHHHYIDSQIYHLVDHALGVVGPIVIAVEGVLVTQVVCVALVVMKVYDLYCRSSGNHLALPEEKFESEYGKSFTEHYQSDDQQVRRFKKGSLHIGYQDYKDASQEDLNHLFVLFDDIADGQLRDMEKIQSFEATVRDDDRFRGNIGSQLKVNGNFKVEEGKEREYVRLGIERFVQLVRQGVSEGVVIDHQEKISCMASHLIWCFQKEYENGERVILFNKLVAIGIASWHSDRGLYNLVQQLSQVHEVEQFPFDQAIDRELINIKRDILKEIINGYEQFFGDHSSWVLSIWKQFFSFEGGLCLGLLYYEAGLWDDYIVHSSNYSISCYRVLFSVIASSCYFLFDEWEERYKNEIEQRLEKALEQGTLLEKAQEWIRGRQEEDVHLLDQKINDTRLVASYILFSRGIYSS